MRRSRVYLDQEIFVGSTICVAGQQHHYIVHVLRVSVGQEIYLFNGNGRGTQFLCRIAAIRRHELDIVCDQECASQAQSVLAIDLYLALARNTSMDFSIQKATELGVRMIQPLLTEHSQHVPAKAHESRQQHWQKVAISAAEQCGRTSVPQLQAITPLHSIQLTEYDASYALVPGAPTNFVAQLHTQRDAPLVAQGSGAVVTVSSMALLIGPEGDFSTADIAYIQTLGVETACLGQRILRVETAVVAAISTVHAICGDFIEVRI